jgi:hypothetical protein
VYSTGAKVFWFFFSKKNRFAFRCRQAMSKPSATRA